ncbi:hypothetical protein Goari_001073 [Gossypium aridum]|uniref:DUF7745 domain-containing protein n=1 Tax=Gossypium aridum TaxID=34290 RepID=A0A7J8YIL5_GOSAI|nr:hypothetical protein [Gossypium aridum]
MYSSELNLIQKRFLDKVEDNAAVEIWFEETQQEKGDSLTEYGDLPYLLDVKMDKNLFQALTQYKNLTYSYFTLGKVDLAPTVEEYTTLLCCLIIQVEKVYSRATNVLTFLKRLMNITGMSKQ